MNSYIVDLLEAKLGSLQYSIGNKKTSEQIKNLEREINGTQLVLNILSEIDYLDDLTLKNLASLDKKSLLLISNNFLKDLIAGQRHACANAVIACSGECIKKTEAYSACMNAYI